MGCSSFLSFGLWEAGEDPKPYGCVCTFLRAGVLFHQAGWLDRTTEPQKNEGHGLEEDSPFQGCLGCSLAGILSHSWLVQEPA